MWTLFLQDARLVAALESLPRLGSLVLAACADITDRSLQVRSRESFELTWDSSVAGLAGHSVARESVPRCWSLTWLTAVCGLAAATGRMLD